MVLDLSVTEVTATEAPRVTRVCELEAVEASWTVFVEDQVMEACLEAEEEVVETLEIVEEVEVVDPWEGLARSEKEWALDLSLA